MYSCSWNYKLIQPRRVILSITQEMKYRMSVIKHAKRFGVQRAAADCRTTPASIYRWIKLYKDGGEKIEALASKSRRPKGHPNSHTETEIKLIKDMRRRNPNIGLQDLWIKLRERGYTRTQAGLVKALKHLKLSTNPKTKRSPTCKKNKPYEQMSHPGQRVQIDVKYVPKECLSPEFMEKYGNTELYQYTAIDEYSRYRILCGYREHNTYSSSLFLCQVVSAFKALGIEVECVQTDNGPEFTKAFHAKDKNNHSMFEATAKHLGVKLKRIKPHTPKHNGKVERSHREDQKLFYSEIIRLNHLIVDEEDFKRKLSRHQRKTNNRPMRPLSYMSPKQYLDQYFSTKKKEAKKK